MRSIGWLLILLTTTSMAVAQQELSDGDRLFERGEFQAAIEVYEQMPQSMIDDKVANNLALCYLETGKSGTALLYIDEAIAQAPERLNYQFNKGVIQYRAERYEEAEETFEAINSKRSEPSTQVMFWTAKSAEKNGQFEKAYDLYEAVYQLDPSYPNITGKKRLSWWSCILANHWISFLIIGLIVFYLLRRALRAKID